ncbi:hypothetical protein ACSHWB_45075 [Lentzea sp. HUAS TT2]|uniref:hypothetical protein n=1 Tax=Lentzea sp. HUAS TT2 TaxID=3447454 RepID=UPI003F6E937F
MDGWELEMTSGLKSKLHRAKEPMAGVFDDASSQVFTDKDPSGTIVGVLTMGFPAAEHLRPTDRVAYDLGSPLDGEHDFRWPDRADATCDKPVRDTCPLRCTSAPCPEVDVCLENSQLSSNPAPLDAKRPGPDAVPVDGRSEPAAPSIPSLEGP